MAFLTISGILRSPENGEYLAGAKIEFKAIQNGEIVLLQSSHTTTTDSGGAYSMDVNYGMYKLFITYPRNDDQLTPPIKTGIIDSIYISSALTTGDLNDVLLQYQQWKVNENFFGEWSASVTYQSNQSVVHAGNLYYALTDNNVNNNPASSPTDWQNVQFPSVGTTGKIPVFNSSTTIDDSLYTEDMIVAMVEGDFRANQYEAKKRRGGSGFDEFVALSGENVNIGLKADSTTLTISASKININGYNINLLEESISFPDAPTDENARQDFVGLEVWEELVDTKDFVYPLGNTQSLASTINGIATANGTFTGFETYSLFGNWQSSSALIGKGLIWSSLTRDQKMTIVSDPENNIFLNEDGAYIQVRYRVRVVQGLTSNGAEWQKVTQNNTGSLQYFTGLYPKSKGILTSITSDISNYNADETGAFAVDDFGILGCYQALNQNGINGTIDTSISYKGNCFMLPIAMVSRNRNTGGYHPVYNPMGTKEFSDSLPWNTTTVSITSTADCLNASNLLTVSGYISSGVSGRPDGLYYDEINQLDVHDLRLPTNYNKNVDSELADTIKAERRGYEAELELVHIGDVTATLDAKASASGLTGVYTKLTFTGEDILGIGSADIGNITTLNNGIKAYIKNTAGLYREVVRVYVDGAESLVFLHPMYGDITAEFTLTNAFGVVISERTDRFQNNTQQRCEILGDPANYTFSSHVGVANLVDVNDGSSQLPIDITTGATYSHCKVFRLASKYSGVSEVLIDDSVVVASSGYQTTSLTYALAGSSPENNEIVINFTDTYATLGYASEADMANNCVIEIFFDGYSNNFVPSANEEVENRIFSDVYMNNNQEPVYGALLTNELVGKVTVNNSLAPIYTSKKLSEYSISDNQTLINSVNYPIKMSEAVNLGGASNEPASKQFLYQTEKDGLLYNVLNFKEMIFDGTWGDDQKFLAADNIVTTTDDNFNVIIYGTVIDVNPVGFAKE